MFRLTRDSYILPILNEDGTESVVVYPVPVRMIDDYGNWQPIDLTVDPITRRPRCAPYDVVFSEYITSSSAVRFISEVGEATFSLNGYGYDGYESSQDSQPVTISGNTATYILSWGRIVYEVTIYGLKETIYIESDILSDPSVDGLSLDGLCVNIDFGLAQVPFESPLTAIDAKNHVVPVIRSTTGVQIPYIDYTKATMPIAIDPTLNVVLYSTMDLYQYWDSSTGVYAHYPAKDGADDHGYVGWVGMTGAKDPYDTDYLYRYLDKFPLSSFADMTVSGVTYRVANVGSYNLLTLRLEEMDRFIGATFPDPILTDMGTFQGGGGANVYYTASSQLKANLLRRRSSGSDLVLRIRLDSEGTTPGANNISIQGPSAACPPQLVVSGYSTLVQNALASPANAALNISWVNGGGLVAGDYHRIYYTIGTGLTASQVIAANQKIQSSGYTATSAQMTGLPGGTYSVVVVDVQVVGGVAYEGAKSNVQTMVVNGGILSLSGNTIGRAVTSGKIVNILKASGETSGISQTSGRVLGIFGVSGSTSGISDTHGAVYMILQLSGNTVGNVNTSVGIMVVPFASEHSVERVVAEIIERMAWTDIIERTTEFTILERFAYVEVDEMMLAGNAVMLMATFKKFNGDPGDPTDLTVTVYDMAGNQVGDPIVVGPEHRVDIGIYSVPYVPELGSHIFKFSGTLEELPVIVEGTLRVPR